MSYDLSPMLPWHGEWWHQHAGEPATVVLRCGRNGCGDRVGEIKTDGATTLVLRYQKIGEVPVPTTPNAPEDQILRRTDDGYLVPKKRGWPAVVGPLESMSFVMCPTHGKLQVSAEMVAQLRRFVADTQHGSKRNYLMFRGT